MKTLKYFYETSDKLIATTFQSHIIIDVHCLIESNKDLIEIYWSIINSQFGNYLFILIMKPWNNFCSRKSFFKTIPIKRINPDEQTPFITLVDYLLYLHNKETPQILSHTDNTRIASHLEDILNMMVYELYFEEHMKEVGIDVLQFINPKPIDSLKSDKEKAEAIQEFYEWYQKPDNAVRQRMLLVDTRSKDIIGLINKSV